MSPLMSRRRLLFVSAGLTIATDANALPSFSSNARNMERLASGDSSGGSVYDNNPKTEAGRRRRAMTGCKVPAARGSMSERECNLRVMDGDTGFMLETLRKLDCPTCPYGISTAKP